MKSVLHISVVEARIPLLLGRPDLKKLGFVVDFDNQTVHCKRTKETFELEETWRGHLALPFVPVCLSEETLTLTEMRRSEKTK